MDIETRSETGTTTRSSFEDIETDFECPLEWPETPSILTDEDKSLFKWATDRIFRSKLDFNVMDDDWSLLLERPSAPTPDDDLKHGLEDMIEMAARAESTAAKDQHAQHRGSLVTCTDDSFFCKIDAECLVRGTLRVR